ncbi:MAG: dihydropteroate synthase [Moraxellaceae bacterium]|nr:dihydropteroate synthase [Moraxellaceae bacterium]MBP8851486.1 dihydropteroate synthase [Moraxellaceae bacterium]MBP9044884.1 dihydropteroate synthase [Moraxellaceae bacterium]MBP9730265.1 dihydropteroate synthase [Moraxellaceae bacterium]
MMNPVLQCGSRSLSLERPVIMGILNVTPDSFSDGGRYSTLHAALRQAERMCQEGARMIDIGAESTRPGAAPVSVQEELDRLLPVVEAVAREIDIVISVDTSTPEAMAGAAALGAGFINDVRALQRPGALVAAAATSLPICLMHMQGDPSTMQRRPHYDDVFAELDAFFDERIAACVDAGIDASRLVIDPGFGFGKTLEHNVALLKGLAGFRRFGPVLAGWSRKSMLGALLGGAPVDQRLYAGLAAATISVINGASIVRVHDVKATADALVIATAVLQHGSQEK